MKLLGSIVSNINRILTREMSQKTPLVLISCGSFNPITNAHLRMFGKFTKIEFNLSIINLLKIISK